MYDPCNQPRTGFLVSTASLEARGEWMVGQCGDNTGSSGYNPPDFVLKAAKESLDRVDCNQYAPTKVTQRLGMQLAIFVYVYRKGGS